MARNDGNQWGRWAIIAPPPASARVFVLLLLDDGDALVIHAMRMRAKYRDLLTE